MPIGPTKPRKMMIDSHMNTDEVIKAFNDLKAIHFIPMHWGTFESGLDAPTEPIEQLQLLWDSMQEQMTDKVLHLMKFGESKTFLLNTTE
jgi:L-ascorbate metabolism protein UlaG (beta-lactamase superfamily)